MSEYHSRLDSERADAEDAELGQADPPAETARVYRLDLPSGGYVQARIAGEGDPVELTLPCPELVVPVCREAAWGLWAVLSDALSTAPDAVPDWCHDEINPTDQEGNPLPAPTMRRPF